MSGIEYFYSAHSAFAYLGSARLMAIAETAGRPIMHKPFDLHHVMEELGMPSFAARTKAHRAYYFGREIVRWAEHRDVAWLGKRPTHHSNDYTLANCLLVALQAQGESADRLAHALLESHWRDDADLADRATLADIARTTGLDPEPLLAAAATDQVTAAYRDNTQQAIRRSVFGSPTYFVDGDMFYGQDHLEMVERALNQPYAGTWPP